MEGTAEAWGNPRTAHGPTERESVPRICKRGLGLSFHVAHARINPKSRQLLGFLI